MSHLDGPDRHLLYLKSAHYFGHKHPLLASAAKTTLRFRRYGILSSLYAIILIAASPPQLQ